MLAPFLELGTAANSGAHNHITFDKIIFLKIDSLNVNNGFQNLYANIIVKLKPYSKIFSIQSRGIQLGKSRINNL